MLLGVQGRKAGSQGPQPGAPLGADHLSAGLQWRWSVLCVYILYNTYAHIVYIC